MTIETSRKELGTSIKNFTIKAIKDFFAYEPRGPIDGDFVEGPDIAPQPIKPKGIKVHTLTASQKS